MLRIRLGRNPFYPGLLGGTGWSSWYRFRRRIVTALSLEKVIPVLSVK